MSQAKRLYFLNRASAEREASALASCQLSADAHSELARLYEKKLAAELAERPTHELRTVLRHIDESADRIARQKAIIARLNSLGASTGLSEQILANFQDAQVQHVEHLERLKRR